MEEAAPPMQGEDFASCKPDTFLKGTSSPFIVKDFSFTHMVAASCPFGSDGFLDVMLHLINNPNITSSHLFRADIFYDSLNDSSFGLEVSGPDLTTYSRHMKGEYRPLHIDIENYEHTRLLVRQLVPRNPQLDKPLVQTCHLMKQDRRDTSVENTLVVMLPHASEDQIPWYHPTVRALAFLHSWSYKEGSEGAYHNQIQDQGNLSLHVSLFPNSTATTPNNRLVRTLQSLLFTIHKHGFGNLRGYVKRVHHDQVIPQRQFQDTYAQLKAKYAKQLIGAWSEQTDPAKHVFEDLGIAAFCIELWRGMYSGCGSEFEDTMLQERDDDTDVDKYPAFPGFLDIGCGNGVLVYILRCEGYKGWGFDARRRKTWDTFPTGEQLDLKQMVLLPSVLDCEAARNVDQDKEAKVQYFNFPSQDSGMNRAATSPTLQGIFIISNHADELTLWTPLLAYLNDSPFLSIPCCSHDFGGARFRAPAARSEVATPTSQASEPKLNSEAHSGHLATAKTGSAPRPSAYASLTSYLSWLTAEIGYEPEKEMLRIPSTRNACVIGRRRAASVGKSDAGLREERVKVLVEKEMGKSIEAVRLEWMARAQVVVKGQGKGH